MGKDPAFLFYPNDYLGGTMGFDFEMHGMYLVMMIFQFNNGPFTYEKAQSICKNQFDSIKHKFCTSQDGLYYNDRLKQEVDKRKAYSESRRENVKKRYDKPTYVEDVNNICSTYGLHMENENRNINKDVFIGSKEEDCKGKQKPEWKENVSTFEKYQEWELEQYTKITNDRNWIESRKEYHPNLDILLTLKKAHVDFWSTKAGWKNIKSRKGSEVDWSATWVNALTMDCNRVWKPKQGGVEMMGLLNETY
jgi:hypothetical protein